MNRNLSILTLPQLIALGYQNKIYMKAKPTREYLIKELDSLKIIVGLETNENG